MRIWHEQLIPHLCRPHLLACWREALGAYAIITQNKKGYRNHPATQEFIDAPYALWCRLKIIRNEMLKRGWNPKPLPRCTSRKNTVHEWQTLEEQIIWLQTKQCQCDLSSFIKPLR